MSVGKPIEDFTLKELQAYVQEKAVERGFELKDHSKKLVMLMEEVGELAKAIRTIAGIKFSDSTEKKEVADELADVQIVLLGVAQMCEIDMAQAVANKELKNETRTWK